MVRADPCADGIAGASSKCMTKEMSASHCRNDHMDIRSFLASQERPASDFPITLANFRSKNGNENPTPHELKVFAHDKTTVSHWPAVPKLILVKFIGSIVVMLVRHASLRAS